MSPCAERQCDAAERAADFAVTSERDDGISFTQSDVCKT